MVRMSTDAVVGRTTQLLDYLAALSREIKEPPTRDVLQTSFLLQQVEVPQHREIRIGPTADDRAWLKVGQARPVPPVKPPSTLTKLLDPNSIKGFAQPALRRDLPPTPDLLENQRILDEWLETEWRPWVQRAKEAEQARKVYRDLYQLRQQAERDEVSHELVWGRAVLSWNVRGTLIRVPILTTPVDVEISDHGSLRVLPTQAPQLDLDALDGLDVPGARALESLRKELRESPPDLWDSPAIETLRARFLAPLGLDAARSTSVSILEPKSVAALNDGWVLYLRRRPQLYEKLYESLSRRLRVHGVLPTALASIVADEESVAAAALERNREPKTRSPLDGRVLLPLPANPEQERIATQLISSRGVTVQGPPGTGKSHTIANLVSHLVAQGKRVLVTAQKEQALGVLQDKLPEPLRDVCVTLLGANSAAIDKVRLSVQQLLGNASVLDPDRQLAKISQLTADLDRVQLERTSAEDALLNSLASESQTFPVEGETLSAAEVARWYVTRRHLDVIPDRVDPWSDPPLEQGEFDRLRELVRRITPAEQNIAAEDLPDAATLPSASDLQQWWTRQDQLDQLVLDSGNNGLRVDALTGATSQDVAALAMKVQSAAEEFGLVQGLWEQRVLHEISTSKQRADFWSTATPQLRESLGRLNDLHKVLLGHECVIPEGDHRAQTEHLNSLSERFAAGRRLPRFGSKPLRDFHASVSVNGLAVRNVDEINLLRASLQFRLQRAALAQLLRQVCAGTPVPPPPLDDHFTTGAERVVEQLERICHWHFVSQPRLRAVVEPLVTDIRVLHAPLSLTQLASDLHSSRSRYESREIAAALARIAQAVGGATSTSTMRQLLSRALDARDAERWGMLISEVSRIRALRPDCALMAELSARLRSRAPQFAEEVISADFSASLEVPLADVWQLTRAHSWLQDLHGASRAGKLLARLSEAGREHSDLTLKLVTEAAHLSVQQHLKGSHRQALNGWLQALKKRGKGTGRYAEHWEQVARELLPSALGAIPVWIMPLHRVLENFDPETVDPFDVVIVDESSQCDLLSVGILALADQAIIVGDDKQTSPELIGYDRESVFALQRAHLSGVPQNDLLMPDESFYSVAERTFGDVVLLREHFRSVPDIIGFSNRFYQDRIVPLREMTRPEIGPPVNAIHVPDGMITGTTTRLINATEADALVNKVVECADDPAYEGLTFGVVTTQSGGQAAHIDRLLQERLGFDEYRTRQLRTGQPSEFQGDERNVVFLSVVAETNSYAATRQQDEQRINVAASRAQDQMWVFHTVNPGTLNINDQRRALIEYASDTSRQDNHTEGDYQIVASTDLERAVMGHVAEHYRIIPHHRIGAYQIDMVVDVGEGLRLAVEIDGDQVLSRDGWKESMRRQHVLERIGWQFHRVRGSEYWLDPVAAMAPLLERLSTMSERAAVVRQHLDRQKAERAAAAAEAARVAAEAAAAKAPQEDSGDSDEIDGVAAVHQRSQEASTPRSRGVEQASTADIRSWAVSQGYQVGERGRLPGDIRDAYYSYHTVQSE